MGVTTYRQRLRTKPSLTNPRSLLIGCFFPANANRFCVSFVTLLRKSCPRGERNLVVTVTIARQNRDRGWRARETFPRLIWRDTHLLWYILNTKRYFERNGRYGRYSWNINLKSLHHGKLFAVCCFTRDVMEFLFIHRSCRTFWVSIVWTIGCSIAPIIRANIYIERYILFIW